MIALMLQDALVERIRDLLAGQTLPSKGGLRTEVKVFPQFLPLPGVPEPGETEGTLVFSESLAYGEGDLERNFPCVIVKLDDGTDREEGDPKGTRIGVRILVGVYDETPDCQGFRDALNIVEQIRQCLLSERYLGGKYRLEMPLEWHLFDEQPWPCFFAVVESTWGTGRPLDGGTGRKGDVRNGTCPDIAAALGRE
jgi:hypothetical protein